MKLHLPTPVAEMEPYEADDFDESWSREMLYTIIERVRRFNTLKYISLSLFQFSSHLPSFLNPESRKTSLFSYGFQNLFYSPT